MASAEQICVLRADCVSTMLESSNRQAKERLHEISTDYLDLAVTLAAHFTSFWERRDPWVLSCGSLTAMILWNYERKFSRERTNSRRGVYARYVNSQPLASD